MKKHRMPMSAPMIPAIQREIEQPGTGKRMTRRIEKNFEIVRVSDRSEFVGLSPYPLSKTDRGDCAYVELADGRFVGIPSPYGGPGDLIAFTETWRPIAEDDTGFTGFQYRSDGEIEESHEAIIYCNGSDSWRSPRFMPYWASRYTGVVTDVRVERLWEITEADAIAEGLCTLTTGLTPSETKHRQDHPYALNEGWGSNDEDSFSQHGWDDPRMVFADLWDSLHGPDAWVKNPWVWCISFRPIAANILDVKRSPAAYGLEAAT